MGTTLVVCLFYDNPCWVAHHRRFAALRPARRQVQQVTRDHSPSLLQEQIDRA